MKLDIDFHKIDLPVELMQICGVSAACVYAVLRAETNENGKCALSKNEISRITGIHTKSVQRIIVKLEALGIVERHYNPGYATSYYVKDILSESKPAEQPEQQAPTEVPAKQVEPVQHSEWQPAQGLKPGYQYYGAHCWIMMTPDEYNQLINMWGKAAADNLIQTIDTNREAHRQELEMRGITYYNQAYVIDWHRKDWEKQKEINAKIRKKPMNDIISEQEYAEMSKYLDLVNNFD